MRSAEVTMHRPCPCSGRRVCVLRFFSQQKEPLSPNERINRPRCSLLKHNTKPILITSTSSFLTMNREVRKGARQTHYHPFCAFISWQLIHWYYGGCDWWRRSSSNQIEITSTSPPDQWPLPSSGFHFCFPLPSGHCAPVAAHHTGSIALDLFLFCWKGTPVSFHFFLQFQIWSD